MNKIITFTGLAAVLLLAACHERVLNKFDATSSLFFYRGTNNAAGVAQSDSTSYSFFIAAGNTVQDTVWLDVRLTGVPANVDRPFPIVQLNADEPGASVAGVHHLPVEGAMLPAGAISTLIPVVVKRVPEMDTVDFRLQLGISANEHFVEGIKDRTSYVVHITAMAVKPAGWDLYYDATFGEWGQAKMKFIIDYLGYTSFDESLINADMRVFLNLKVRKLLADYEAENGPLFEADEVTQVIFP
ncbi:MAG: DUF4843 domain-containing protein [Odoribacteraceae bacterium]|jgi:hypothetical protein|nr:DUF4843 domain-containing protein [Odoribacteraceae bacterium]